MTHIFGHQQNLRLWDDQSQPSTRHRGRVTKGSDMLLAVLIGVSSAVVDNVPLVQATETPRPRSCWDAEKNPKKKNAFFLEECGEEIAR